MSTWEVESKIFCYNRAGWRLMSVASPRFLLLHQPPQQPFPLHSLLLLLTFSLLFSSLLGGNASLRGMSEKLTQPSLSLITHWFQQDSPSLPSFPFPVFFPTKNDKWNPLCASTHFTGARLHCARTIMLTISFCHKSKSCGCFSQAYTMEF